LVARLFNTRTKVNTILFIRLTTFQTEFRSASDHPTKAGDRQAQADSLCVIYAQIVRKSIEKFLFSKNFLLVPTTPSTNRILCLPLNACRGVVPMPFIRTKPGRSRGWFGGSPFNARRSGVCI
jgi:hypothetical protein